MNAPDEAATVSKPLDTLRRATTTWTENSTRLSRRGSTSTPPGTSWSYQGRGGDLAVQLDRGHVPLRADEAGQQGGVVTGPRPDLEHPLPVPQVEHLEHARHDRRLRRRRGR